MDKNRFCPLPSAVKCSSKCGFYSIRDKSCSINLLAEALISLINVKGKVFTGIATSGGRVTIPIIIRQELNIKEGDSIKMVVVKEMETEEDLIE